LKITLLRGRSEGVRVRELADRSLVRDLILLVLVALGMVYLR
jgi:hypothetical protein